MMPMRAKLIDVLCRQLRHPLARPGTAHDRVPAHVGLTFQLLILIKTVTAYPSIFKQLLCEWERA